MAPALLGQPRQAPESTWNLSREFLTSTKVSPKCPLGESHDREPEEGSLDVDVERVTWVQEKHKRAGILQKLGVLNTSLEHVRSHHPGVPGMTPCEPSLVMVKPNH